MTQIDTTTKRLFKHPKKRRAWVLYQVQLQGRSLAQIAEAAGVRRQVLYSAFLYPYPRIEKVIADAVGVRPQMLFPERYDADGLPNRKRGRPRKAPEKIPCHGSKDKPSKRSGDIQAEQAA